MRTDEERIEWLKKGTQEQASMTGRPRLYIHPYFDDEWRLEYGSRTRPEMLTTYMGPSNLPPEFRDDGQREIIDYYMDKETSHAS